MAETTVGFAVTGSFCTFKAAFEQMQVLCSAGFRVIPIMSGNAYETDTRFGRAKDWQALALVSDKTVKCAQIFLASLPILCVYPFLQKYFVKGMVLGSVKG